MVWFCPNANSMAATVPTNYTCLLVVSKANWVPAEVFQARTTGQQRGWPEQHNAFQEIVLWFRPYVCGRCEVHDGRGCEGSRREHVGGSGHMPHLPWAVLNDG